MPDGGKEEQELKATNGNGKPRSEIGGEKITPRFSHEAQKGSCSKKDKQQMSFISTLPTGC